MQDCKKNLEDNFKKETEFVKRCLEYTGSYKDPESDGYSCLYCSTLEMMFGQKSTTEIIDGKTVTSADGYEIPCAKGLEMCGDGSCDFFEEK